jgi:hypothetical protein
MMKTILIAMCVVHAFAYISQSQGSFLEVSPGKKIYRIALKEQTNQVKSQKEIFDFISTRQTYFRKNPSDYAYEDIHQEVSSYA